MNRPLIASLLVFLAACPGPTEPVGSGLHGVFVEPHHLPDRAGDPIGVDITLVRTWNGESVELCGNVDETIPDSTVSCQADRSEDAITLRDADGNDITATERIDDAGNRWAWALPHDSPPGIYSITGVEGVDVPMTDPVAFEVFDYGAATDFDAETLVGQVYELDDFATWPFDAAGIIEGSAPRILFTIDSVDGDEARFRVVADSPADLCTVLTSDAVVDESRLVWERDMLAVTHPELGELRADDLFLELAWATGLPNSPDIRADATVDLRPFAGVIEGVDDPCSVLDDLASGCQQCPDGEEACFDAHAHQGRVKLVSDELPLDLPLCGVEDVDVGPVSLSCDVDWEIEDCGCSGAHVRGYGPWGVMVLALIGLRRRRPGNGVSQQDLSRRT